MNEATLTRSLEKALTGSLRANRDLLRDLLAEVMEDLALTNAIREGEKSKSVTRRSVMKALGQRA